MKKLLSLLLLYLVAVLLLPSVVSSQESVVLWDDDEDVAFYTSIYNAPPPLDYGVGYGFENVEFTYNYTEFYSGIMSVRLRDYYRASAGNDWVGFEIYSWDEEYYPVPMEINEFLSICIYGTNSTSEIMIIVEHYDQDWQVLGRSYMLHPLGDSFLGWQKLEYPVSDFITFPLYDGVSDPVDWEQVACVRILFNKMVQPVYGVRFADLLETGVASNPSPMAEAVAIAAPYAFAAVSIMSLSLIIGIGAAILVSYQAQDFASMIPVVILGVGITIALFIALPLLNAFSGL